jgi:hypothetical protein
MKMMITPDKARIRPDASRFVIFSPRKGIARSAVMIGLNVIISEASPAAVYFIPNMKKT